ncbi:hypothetical protein CcCBS67573_g07006 [Chytriomyces confervae]|uniref:Uncharacterized protein n=1 Tax=Chytriomyces confervae TaxID=246404 RepID=A0A507EYE8_9FUNG|nr:Myb-like, SWIRM and MPN domains 1 [Chytriomyces hyalinus]TPX68961.1 hypothetical protein CcCBS67573_g07006 [Chytriomyces confervae]
MQVEIDSLDPQPFGLQHSNPVTDPSPQLPHASERLVAPSQSDSSAALFTLDPLVPHPLEIKACPDFFLKTQPTVSSRPPPKRSSSSSKKKQPTIPQQPKNVKNSDRYLLIRNTIVTEWNRIKPKYLLKSACRPLLKGQGDVHAISRVHEFLERIGCINVDPDLTGVRPNSVSPAILSKKRKLEGLDDANGDGGDGTGQAQEEEDSGWLTFFKGDGEKRQRRVRNTRGEWVDPSELRDGRTIVHGEDGRPLSDEEPMSAADIEEERRMLLKNARYFADEELAKHDPSLLKRKRRQLERQFYHYGNDDDDMNEFRLIPLHHFKTESNPNSAKSAPFRVLIDSNVQMVIDFHAHLAETEIIGLLGGTYDHQNRILYVNEAFPCKSISTTIQCEMDPESEVKAHIYFASQNKVVVGWYHSHPTFDPNPSVRDIETQTDHQHLFLREETEGGPVEPFVGAIYSPYDASTAGVVSRSEWMCVGNEVSSSGKYRLPFSCDYKIVPSVSLTDSLLKQLFNLIDEFKNYEFRVDLTHTYKSDTTRLEKTIGALQIHADSCIGLIEGGSGEESGVFVAKVKTKLVDEFSKLPKQK